MLQLSNPRKPSAKLTEKDALEIRRLLREGYLQSRIAAQFDVNAGRISEINTGKRFPGVPPTE